MKLKPLKLERMTRKLKALFALLKSDGYILITKNGNVSKYDTAMPFNDAQKSCAVLYNALEASQSEGMVRQANDILKKA